jgi:hypothetical protein
MIIRGVVELLVRRRGDPFSGVVVKFGGCVANVAPSPTHTNIRKKFAKMPRDSRRKRVLDTLDATVRVSRALGLLFDEEDDVLAKRRRRGAAEMATRRC